MKQIRDFVRKNSVDNLRVGKVVSKEGSRYIVRVGSTRIVCYFSGSAGIGDIVSIDCPDGADNKGFIVSTSPVILAEGENVIL